jgi:glycosyltransferase involved in cell wall biosynthesis
MKSQTHMPRVAHVVTRLGCGGLETGLLSLLPGLARLGFAQAVCCLAEGGELSSRVPNSVELWATKETGRMPSRFARFLRTWQPDVIHIRNAWAWPAACAAWSLAGWPGKLAFSIHGWDRLDRVPSRRAFLFRQLARMTRALAAVSTETAQQFALETGIPARRFKILKSGIDTEKFFPVTQNRSDNRLVIGCVGRLDPIKAHGVLLEAFARARANGPRELELRLIGDGPCRPDLERALRASKLEQHVRLLGTISNVAEQLRACDLFVLASQREGRPTSIMEAMACGLPVVATRVGSVPDLVVEGKTGFLVEPGDAAALAERIGTLADDESTRAQFGREARKIAVVELSLDHMVEQYAAFYQHAAQGASSLFRRMHRLARAGVFTGI